MRSIPHAALPMRLDRRGEPAIVEQDTVVEVAQSVEVLIRTRPGDRSLSPQYGIDDPTFNPAAESLVGLTDVAQRFEPRATVEVVERAIVGGNVDVTVEVS